MRRIEVKICGITTLDDASAAMEYGADYIGFVFHPKSPRFIPPARVTEILGKLPPGTNAVGVFVNSPRKAVETMARDCGLHAVQLHGDEDAVEFSRMPLPVWRSVKFVGALPEPAPAKWMVHRYVVDATVHGQHGGTGATADWHHAAGFALKYPVMLAGGLTPDNVAHAIATVNPVGVDVSSGVESVPGRKDLKKLKRFIQLAKNPSTMR